MRYDNVIKYVGEIIRCKNFLYCGTTILKKLSCIKIMNDGYFPTKISCYMVGIWVHTYIMSVV